MKQEPLISVCIPVYNASAFINECIDSVLAQTCKDFELILVDDGSTDESCTLIEAYTDTRIRLIRNKHDFIHSKNKMLDEARGKYIALLDADDRMLPDRLQVQADYMEEHPEIDALGGGVWTFGNGSHASLPGIIGRAITLDEMIEGNQLYNPTVMLRREKLEQNHIQYPKEYIYANDYALWMRMLFNGMHLENMDRILTEYRSSPGQISSKHQKEQAYYANLIKEEAIRIKTNNFQEKPTDLKKLRVPVTGNKLTLIIPFLNEKDEVRNTVASARQFAGDAVDIITINDHSTDRYDYPADLQPYNVTYIYNKERLGVAASRDLGVSLCTTPYFLLLDAHMRFYDGKWPERITSLLENDDRCMLCCQTRYLSKDKDGNIHTAQKAITSFGAYMPCTKGNYLPDIRWNSIESCPEKSIEDIPTILGAGYAGSTRYWQYLRGLEGLMYYGSDEAYISSKVWMEGGKCLLLKDIIIGHIYRTGSPFRHHSEAEVFNYLWIANLIFPMSWRCLAMATALYRDRETYNLACKLLADKKTLQNELKAYYRSIFTIPFKEMIKLHRKISKKQMARILQKATDLPDIATFLQKNEPSNYGLTTGKMGHLVWFSHYAQYIKDKEWENEISHLWEQITKAIENECLSFNFAEGLGGIGWSIFYLYEHHLIDNIPVKIIQAIDKQIAYCNLTQIAETNLNYGISGILAYCIQRYTYALKHQERIPWNSPFLEALKQSALFVLQEKSELTALNYAMQYLELITNGYDKDDFKPALHDWMIFQDYLPQSQEHWTIGLTGNAAASYIQIMLIKNTLTY